MILTVVSSGALILIYWPKHFKRREIDEKRKLEEAALDSQLLP
jgi:hypothetical protein